MLAGHQGKRGAPVFGLEGHGPPRRDPGSFDLNYLPWAERPLFGHSSRIIIRPGPGIPDANLFSFFFNERNAEMQ